MAIDDGWTEPTTGWFEALKQGMVVWWRHGRHIGFREHPYCQKVTVVRTTKTLVIVEDTRGAEHRIKKEIRWSKGLYPFMENTEAAAKERSAWKVKATRSALPRMFDAAAVEALTDGEVAQIIRIVDAAKKRSAQEAIEAS